MICMHGGGPHNNEGQFAIYDPEDGISTSRDIGGTSPDDDLNRTER